MSFDEYLIGAIVALPFEILGHWGWDEFVHKRRTRALKKKYGFLARQYRNLHDFKPTGGRIDLSQQHDGSFSITAYNVDRSIEWTGSLSMSTTEEDVGAATYQYVSGINHGTQRVVYVRDRDVLHVVGTNQSTLAHAEFIHVWEPFVRRDKTLI